MIEVRRYQQEDGRVPVTEWLASMRDKIAQASARTRIRRLEAGSLGDCKTVGGGVLELRIDVGAGYRLYCARHGNELVLLLCGGEKGSQSSDIKQAKAYWSDWKRRNT